jgi:hypothetical protein
MISASVHTQITAALADLLHLRSALSEMGGQVTAVVEAIGQVLDDDLAARSKMDAVTSAHLTGSLEGLGDAYGPMGVALAAAALTNTDALIAALTPENDRGPAIPARAVSPDEG